MVVPRLLRLRTWFSVGIRRKPEGWLKWFVTAWAAGIGAYAVWAATIAIIDPWELTSIFLTAAFVLLFLTIGPFPSSDERRPNPLDWAMAAASVGLLAYCVANGTEIAKRIALLDPLTPWDLAVGTGIFALTLEATRRTTGLGLTAVVLGFVLYNFFGHLLPGVLGHGYIGYTHFLDIMVFTTDGIMGLPLRVAATYAFLFVMFGTVLSYCGGAEFFFNLAALLSGRRPGGPAKIAVVSSGMYGMISGSPTADVVTTGSITIPMMKRLGYKPALAGAVEVAASTGGSIMPPVMGSAAFIMAEYTGIEYRDIAVAALLPALLYYLGVYSQVHFRSVKMGLQSLDTAGIPTLGATLREGWLFIVPLVVLTWALLDGYDPSMVALFGTISVIITAAFRKKSRIGPIGIMRALAETTQRAIPVIGACAAAGLVIAGISMTGLAPKFSHLVNLITEGQLFLTLFVAALLTIVLGCGMPTPSAYILAAVLIGPILAAFKIPPMAAHMFLLYFAVVSALTPPVAVAAFAAATIADANPLHIAAVATRLALAAFIVPFAFVFGPELLLIGAWHKTLVAGCTAAAGVLLVAAAVEGYVRAPMPWWSRVLAAAGGLCLIAPNVTVSAVGAVLGAAAFAHSWFARGAGAPRSVN
ncbi:MAG: TRAP transporter fused permease subunit [Burkholderiales bacterium]|nr:TRAP transporter fused permease subunit [Burkholderiales bacterium]